MLAGGLEAVWEEGSGGCWGGGCGCCCRCHFGFRVRVGVRSRLVGLDMDGRVGLNWTGCYPENLSVGVPLFFELGDCLPGRGVN